MSRRPIPPIAPLVRNILAIYDTASVEFKDAGELWYQVALDECIQLSREYSLSTIQAVGIVAALSPNLRWERNVRAAHAVLNGDMSEAYPANEYKARRIAAGESPESVLGGLKVRSFFRNIMSGGFDNSVTVDGHAYNAAHDLRQPVKAARISPRDYQRLTIAYRTAARLRSVTPPAMQATVWIEWRDGLESRYHPRHWQLVAA